MKLGTKDVTALKVGSVNASRAYLGSTLAWEAPGGGEYSHFIESLPTLTQTGGQMAGWEFTANVPLTLIGMRCYAASAASPESLRLYRASDFAMLASVEVMPVVNEWVEGFFDTPVALQAATNYVLGMRPPANDRLHHTAAAANVSLVDSVTYVTGRYGNFSAWAGNLMGIVDGIIQE